MFNRKDIVCLTKIIVAVTIYMVVAINAVPMINYKDSAVALSAAIVVLFGLIVLVTYTSNVVANYYKSTNSSNSSNGSNISNDSDTLKKEDNSDG